MWEESKNTPTDDTNRLLKRALNHRQVIKHKFFFGYLRARIKRTPLYVQWQELLTSFRRIRLLTRLLRLLGILFSLIETGTLVLLSTALFLVILPVLVLLMAGILLTAWVKSHHANKILWHQLADHPIVITFSGDALGDFQKQNLRDLAARGYAVLLISPHWISPDGIRSAPFYVTFREEENGIYLIRPYYFFSLRKRALQSQRLIWMF